jgi:hypothetical protein
LFITLIIVGVKTVLLSGDRQEVVKNVANQLGIDEFYAQVTPSGKLEIIKKLQGEGKALGMVGDGKWLDCSDRNSTQPTPQVSMMPLHSLRLMQASHLAQALTWQ